MLTEENLIVIINALISHSDFDLSNYSRKSLMRRVERVMVNQRLSFNDIIKNIVDSKKFQAEFVNEITVNTTELFRDVKVWQFMRTNILPVLAKRNKINIWLAGVSKGHEVYSLMILLNEMNLLHRSHIVATDINDQVLAQAKSGLYKYWNNLDFFSSFDATIRTNPLNYEEKYDVPYEKYFTVDKEKDEIVMKKFLREKPLFLQHDLVKGDGLNFTKFDLIFCRNVLIYFDQTLQNRVLNMFHKNMFPESFLLLGIHESIIGAAATKYMKKGMAYTNTNK